MDFWVSYIWLNFVKDIIIATTTNKIDDEIVNLANNSGVKFFRGSESDVLGRVVGAAKENKTDIIVQITGDNPLVHKEIVENIIKFYTANQDKYDFVSNDAGIYNDAFKQEFPMGLNTKVFASSLLFDVEKITTNLVDREHVVNYILKNCNKYRVHNFKAENRYCRPDLRFTLDYPEDYEFLKRIFNELYIPNNVFSLFEIIKLLKTKPELMSINRHCMKLCKDHISRTAPEITLKKKYRGITTTF